jgi:hypothetical protein
VKVTGFTDGSVGEWVMRGEGEGHGFTVYNIQLVRSLDRSNTLYVYFISGKAWPV